MLRAAIVLSALLAGCAAAGPPRLGPDSATARLGQLVTVGAVAVTPRRVEEDSRCPSDVQCVQAGTVRLAAVVREQGAGGEQILTLGQPLRLDRGWLTLCAVRPYPARPGPIPRAGYRFRFAFAAGGPPACPGGG